MQQAQHQQPPHTSRRGEYKSAEEASKSLLAAGQSSFPRLSTTVATSRLPLLRPAGQQRSPLRIQAAVPAGDARVPSTRGVASPPLGTGRGPRRMPFGEGRDSPESQRAKREEFLRLCERAWDLFHS
ncbi:hypothetical protein MCOR02_008223 [Pyricularia oryzae]|nr:hypothetical protein MCOR02_008223 [Pyricularia oryzae]